ncbi:hypothetical protein [Pseudomonas pudica]|uniref:Uncharacterized protein n=1 Tax=Pseudomonas pudica TaxID=272772 RepID=A0ABS0G2K5_9PSED|nr:hypothetical protein [Pseudomonas pudica]MBF8646834.1 hypothetical protein [Pseudomonas pudica]MBF8760802.1 hypothetical protein [Pseudomonas pudica]
MPTENRSSNTDPRDVFIRLNPLGLGEAELRKDSTGFEDQRTHSDYLLFLAGYRETHPEPQPHPEPIAWMVGTAFWWTQEEAERDATETGLPMIPVGPMTGAGGIGLPKSKPRVHNVTMFQRASAPPTVHGHKLNCKALHDYKPGECSCGHVEASAPAAHAVRAGMLGDGISTLVYHALLPNGCAACSHMLDVRDEGLAKDKPVEMRCKKKACRKLFEQVDSATS